MGRPHRGPVVTAIRCVGRSGGHRPVHDPSVLFLARKSFTVLAEGGYLDDYPPLAWTNKRAHVSDMTLRHELDVMDLKAAVFTAVAKCATLRIAEFSTWPLLYEFHACPGEGRRSIAGRPASSDCTKAQMTAACPSTKRRRIPSE